MAKKAAEAKVIWNNDKLKQAKEDKDKGVGTGKPDYILADQWDDVNKPVAYLTCPKCGNYTQGLRSDKCKAEINGKLCDTLFIKKEKTEAAAPKATSKAPSGQLTLANFESAKNLITNLGGGDIALTVQALKEIQKLGSIHEALKAVEGWEKLVDSAGNEDQAEATLKVLKEMGAIS